MPQSICASICTWHSPLCAPSLQFLWCCKDKSAWIRINYNPKHHHLTRRIIPRPFLDKFIGLYSVVPGGHKGKRKPFNPLTYDRQPKEKLHNILNQCVRCLTNSASNHDENKRNKTVIFREMDGHAKQHIWNKSKLENF